MKCDLVQQQLVLARGRESAGAHHAAVAVVVVDFRVHLERVQVAETDFRRPKL
jgi:hypothetical protein